MAKKSRTPRPPRPVQAPKRRTEARDPRRTRIWIAALLGVLLLAGAVAGTVFALGRGGDAEAGVCKVQTFPSQGSRHVAKLPKNYKPNSYPRTSGPHHPQTLVFSDYERPVPELNAIHNLEHGGVLVQYGKDVSPETVRRLVDWYRVDPRGLILAPFPDNEKAARYADRIVLAAWVAELEDEDNPRSRVVKQNGVLGVCSGFDEDAFDDFLDKYRAQGPERFELDQLAPGSS